MQSHKKFTPQLQNKSQIINNKVMIRVDLRMSIAIMPHNNLHARQGIPVKPSVNNKPTLAHK